MALASLAKPLAKLAAVEYIPPVASLIAESSDLPLMILESIDDGYVPDSLDETDDLVQTEVI